MKPDVVLDACRTSDRNLVAAVGSLSDEELRSPSLLPRYSRAHVIAHVINKAKAHLWLFGGPAANQVRLLHPDPYDADNAADAGARRSSRELRSDLEHSLVQLEAAWDALDDAEWDWQGIMTAGPRTMAEIVRHHLRDVEVHHVDLDVGYRPADWPAVFIEGELAKRLGGLRDRADPAELLAWLLDRAPAPELGPW